ncbi:MAG: hypothetical protein HYZ34_15275, partial [Ignavibacteriae bacterium]|nr:hypothetical protein [Ignavibacteriota bacterium]
MLIVSISCTVFPQIKFLENGQPSPKGSDAAVYFDSPNRVITDLSGQWRYSSDGSEWLETTIPGAYDAINRVTFVRNVEINSSMLDSYTFQLVAFGINYQSEVTLNGTLIGRHLGGYSSFVVPIPANVLQAGSENVISISVDNELTPKTTLPLRQQVGGWRSYGGITRDLFILATPKLFIDDADIKYVIAQDGRTATLQIKPEILDRGFSASEQSGGIGFVVEVFHAGTDSLAGRSQIVPLNFQKNKPFIIETQLNLNEPKLWSPEFP